MGVFCSSRFRAIESGLISSSHRRMSSRQSFFEKTSGAVAMRRRISGCRRVSNMKIARGGGPDGVVRRADRHELPVAEVVDEPHPQGVEQQAVTLRAFAEPRASGSETSVLA